MLYEINKTKADINAVYLLCITKNDLNYPKEDIDDVFKFSKDNNLEIIFTSSFSDNYGLNDDSYDCYIRFLY